MSNTNLLWGEVILSTIFLLSVVMLRIWAANKCRHIHDKIEGSEFKDAFNALQTVNETTFALLIVALVWIANAAWSKL